MAKKSYLADCQSAMLDILLFIDDICSKNNLTYWIDGGTLLGSVRHDGFIPWDDDIDICLLYPDYKKLLDILELECPQHKFYHTYYKTNNIDHWCEYIGDTRILAHGMLSTRIDLIPIKAIPNTKEDEKIDRSLNNIANFFIKGKFKNETRILDEHREKYLGKFENLDQAKRLFFKDFNAYMEVNTRLDENLQYTYSFHDMLVGKTRRYYRYDELFPTRLTTFAGHKLSIPNNVDSYLRVLYGDNYMTPPPKDKQKPYADIYYFNDFSKARTTLHSKIFIEREAKHYKARMKKSKLGRYKEKFLSFLSLTNSCIQNKALVFWWIHLQYVIKKSLFGARF